MFLAPFYRDWDLPWEADEESSRRFRRLVLTGLALLLVMGLIIPLLHLPDRKESAAEAVPERLARLMVEEKPLPPPPPPPPKPPQPQPTTETKPQPVPPPVDRVAEARRQAEQSMSRARDELEDLRRELTLEPVAQTQNLTGAVGAESKAERSMIASKAGSGSAGVVSTDSSRGFGGGAGSLTGHTTAAVSSQVAGIVARGTASRSGASGKGSRSPEEIELEFDRNKGAIYALYSRALRDRPELQGKMVLEFTIAPSGEITACRVVSSELNDPELERKIVARVRLIRFSARDVETMTTTKPIEFVPA
jgi:TonB family protein